MSGDRFLEEVVSSQPYPLRNAKIELELCCLCGDPIGLRPYATQRFEADSSGTAYLAHAICAHEYALCLRAFRGVIARLTP